MPDPEVIGPTNGRPGAVDVRGADGQVRSVAASVLPSLGLTTTAAAPQGMAEAQRQAQAAVDEQMGGAELSPSMADARRQAQASFDEQATRAQADAAALSEQQHQFVDPRTMGLAPVTEADLRTTPAQRSAIARQEAARDEERAQAGRSRMLLELQRRAASGDARSAAQLGEIANAGDPDAREALLRLERLRESGVLRPRGGGGGGPRSTRTDTRRFAGPAREASPQEAEEMRRLRAEQSDIEREQMVGLAAEAEAESRALEQSAGLMEAADLRMRRMREREELAERARQQEMARRSTQLDELGKIAREAKLQPGRILARGQTGNRFNAALAIALGSLGDAFTGGDAGLATSLSIIDRALDQDMEAQRAQLQTKQQAVGNATSALGQARQRFGDERAAEAAARDAVLAGLQRQIEAQLQRGRGEARDAKLRQLMSEIEARRNGLRQQALQSGLGEREVVVQEQTRRGGGGGSRQVVDFDALLASEPDVSGEDRERLAASRASLENTLGEVDRALALLDSTSATGPIGSMFTTFSAEGRDLERTLGRIATPEAIAAFGALGSRDQLDIIADLNGLTIDTRAEEIRENLMRLRTKTRAALEAAELGVGETAVVERAQRAPGVERRVTVQEGRAEDIAPSFRPTGGE